jgi:hypothetical protein
VNSSQRLVFQRWVPKTCMLIRLINIIGKKEITSEAP